MFGTLRCSNDEKNPRACRLYYLVASQRVPKSCKSTPEEVTMLMKSPVLVAARMSSSRLPGKMLMEFGDRPLLSHVVEAVSAAESAGEVVVVTSLDSSDDPIVYWCETYGVDYWRGELNDVARRMLAAARSLSAESFVRISGDSPMIDPRIISFAVDRFAATSVDLVTNVRPKTFPAGQSVEVIRTQTLARLLDSSETTPEDLEHVTPILYRSETEVKVDRFTPLDMQSRKHPPMGPYRSMSVDTYEDANCFRRVVGNCGGASVWMHGWEKCEAMMRVAEQQLHSGLGELRA